MWFPRLIALVGLNRTPNLALVHYDVHRHVVPHSCPHIYPRFPMHVSMYNRRVSSHRMVSLSQLSLIFLSGDVAVNPGPLRLGFANCCSIRNKGLLLAQDVKNCGYDVFGLTETDIKAHDTPFFLKELTPEDFTLVHTPRVNRSSGRVSFFIKKYLNPKNCSCSKLLIC